MSKLKILAVAVLGVLTACATGPSDGVQVTTESDAHVRAAQALTNLCNNPAEFGRCGCYMNGFLTSCDVVNRCLDAGFCVVQKNSMGTNTETGSGQPQ